MTEFYHAPVMLKEVLEYLDPKEGDTVVDVTLGLAGHAKEFCAKIGASGTFIGVDADGVNLQQAKATLADALPTTIFIHDNFIDVADHIDRSVDIIFADLGISSPHVDDSSRGFTFHADVPLDMRFNREFGYSAATLIEKSSERAILELLRDFGEVSQPHKLAREIKKREIRTTFDLKECVEAVFSYKAPKILPQVFQAFRIAVNLELDAVSSLLRFAENHLSDNGKIGFLTYHSLEDRIVKHGFRELTTPIKDDFTGAIAKEAPFSYVVKKPLSPSDQELQANPRSRSAKLRVIQKNSIL